jgi:hypothetical protein
MKLTKEDLVSWNACSKVREWYDKKEKNTVEETVKALMDEDNYDHANWLISRALQLDDKRRYAIFAAKLVLPIFETKYPEDKRPRKAIAAAEKYLESPTEKNAAAVASDAADAADAAVASDAAYAAYAAYAARDAVRDAAYAAYAAYAAADAVDAKETKEKIVNFGVDLLNKAK